MQVRRESETLGRRTHARLDESIPPDPRALGDSGGYVLRHAPLGLWHCCLACFGPIEIGSKCQRTRADAIPAHDGSNSPTHGGTGGVHENCCQGRACPNANRRRVGLEAYDCRKNRGRGVRAVGPRDVRKAIGSLCWADIIRGVQSCCRG